MAGLRHWQAGSSELAILRDADPLGYGQLQPGRAKVVNAFWKVEQSLETTTAAE
jgi:hypothetical protein